MFTITVWKLAGASLELYVSCNETAQALHVEDVLAGGAVVEWIISTGGRTPPRAIHPRDRIVVVNAITGDPQRMLSECAN